MSLKEEVSSHDREMDKLKEQYDAELLALRESVEEATKVGPGQRGQAGHRGGPGPPRSNLCPLLAFLFMTE